jgi:hypothetical protein
MMTQEQVNDICDSMREFYRRNGDEIVHHTGELFVACVDVLAFNENPDLEPGFPEELEEKVKKAVIGMQEALKRMTLKPVQVGLGWFAGSSPEVRKAKTDAYLAREYGLCGCGKPARYIVPDSNAGSCNEHARCPTYDDLLQKIKELEALKRD